MQSDNSDVCVQFCVMFSRLLTSSFGMHKFQNLFSSNYKKNDQVARLCHVLSATSLCATLYLKSNEKALPTNILLPQLRKSSRVEQLHFVENMEILPSRFSFLNSKYNLNNSHSKFLTTGLKEDTELESFEPNIDFGSSSQ